MKKVLILIPPSRAFERGLLKGIAKYSRNHGPWATYMRMPDYEATKDNILRLIRKIRPDGFLIRVPFSGKLEQILAFHAPVIVTNIQEPVNDLHSIEPDCKTPAKLATEYFWAKGFTQFAFCGFTDSYWCLKRRLYFSNMLIPKNHFFSEYYCNFFKDVLLENEQAKLIEWLKSLPKPIAILTTNCDLGRHVLEACKIASIPVPESVSVLGIDNDELTCELATPSLSSIAYNFERTGYEAAELLDKLMAGKNMPIRKIMVRPTHVVTRMSTELESIADPEIANALAYIRQNNKRIIQVDDVVSATKTSRRALERKFSNLLDRSIYSEIIRVRMNRAAQIIIETNLPIGKIASEFGYGEERFFSRCFTSSKGLSPSRYRKQYGNS